MASRRPQIPPPPPPNRKVDDSSGLNNSRRQTPPIPVTANQSADTSALCYPPHSSTLIPTSPSKSQRLGSSIDALASFVLPSVLPTVLSPQTQCVVDVISCVKKESPMGDEDRVLKCVLVGEEAVGKTALIESYSTNGFRDQYRPTAFDNFSVLVSVDKKPVSVQLCDTSGQRSLDSLRPLSYPDADCFIVVYSVVDYFSFQQVSDRWLPEINKGNAHTPIVLVGTQLDRKWSVPSNQVVLTTKGQALKRQMKAAEFFECSALTKENVKAMFDAVILAGIAGKRTYHKQSKIRQGFQRFLTYTKKVF